MITVISIVLVVVLLLFVMFGCVCRRPAPIRMEGFEGSTGGLTSLEKELFEDLRQDKLDDKKIQELVKGGTLTESMVEKFLSSLQEEASAK